MPQFRLDLDSDLSMGKGNSIMDSFLRQSSPYKLQSSKMQRSESHKMISESTLSLLHSKIGNYIRAVQAKKRRQ